MSWEDDWNAHDEAERRDVYQPSGNGGKGKPSGWGTWQGPPPGRGCAGPSLLVLAGVVLAASIGLDGGAQ